MHEIALKAQGRLTVLTVLASGIACAQATGEPWSHNQRQTRDGNAGPLQGAVSRTSGCT